MMNKKRVSKNLSHKKALFCNKEENKFLPQTMSSLFRFCLSALELHTKQVQ